MLAPGQDSCVIILGPLGTRLMVGRLTLDQLIVVRIHGPQNYCKFPLQSYMLPFVWMYARSSVLTKSCAS